MVDGVISWNPGIAQIDTECVSDIDQRSEMINFESIFTTFEASIIF